MSDDLDCSGVLAVLSELLDDQLDASQVARVRGHLRQCDRCERFGGEVAELLATVRERLAVPPPTTSALRGRVEGVLRAAMGAPSTPEN